MRLRSISKKLFIGHRIEICFHWSGNEWDFVILSLVRSMPRDEIEQKPSIGWCQKNMGFIVDEHQINVALTRARMGLVIIGKFNKKSLLNNGNFTLRK